MVVTVPPQDTASDVEIFAPDSRPGESGTKFSSEAIFDTVWMSSGIRIGNESNATRGCLPDDSIDTGYGFDT